jgi:hypothetical protein
VCVLLSSQLCVRRFEAEWRRAPVAVKILTSYVDAEQVSGRNLIVKLYKRARLLQLVELRTECVLMARCSNHPNVVKFVGACTDSASRFWFVFFGHIALSSLI